MEVLVTGGAGFIGSFLADELIKRGHRVRAFDNLDTQVHGADRQLPEYLNAEVRLIRGDVRDADAWCQAVDGVDVVFHLAAAVGVGQSMYEIPRYIDSNVAGTGLLLQHIADLPRARRPSKLVIASSMSVYGEGMYRCAACGMVEIQERCLSSGWEPRCQSCGASLVAVPSPESRSWLFPVLSQSCQIHRRYTLSLS
jgi:dTDP-L-rhamnose 4-epimerase